jgi:uncharacterized protein DUF3618
VTGDGGARQREKASLPELEEDIRRTRAELSLTLDALAYRLTPHQLLGKGVDMISDTIGKNGIVAMNVGEAVRANRLPLALIGAGVAWLLARNLAASGKDGAAAPSSAAPPSAAPSSESSAGGSEGWVHQAAGAARGALHSVRDTGGEMLDRVGHYTDDYANQAKEQVRYVGGSLRSTFEQNPLLIGLIGAISGAALAMLLPATHGEQEWLGKTREELWNKAEEFGHEAADRVRELADRKGQAAHG